MLNATDENIEQAGGASQLELGNEHNATAYITTTAVLMKLM
jgi:hypothetical protein